MPKMKTHSGAKKRFRVTGTGKIRHRQTNRGHLMENKPSKRARRLEKTTNLSEQDTKRVRRLLGL